LLFHWLKFFKHATPEHFAWTAADCVGRGKIRLSDKRTSC
jgi:hypothetical protein